MTVDRDRKLVFPFIFPLLRQDCCKRETAWHEFAAHIMQVYIPLESASQAKSMVFLN